MHVSKKETFKILRPKREKNILMAPDISISSSRVSLLNLANLSNKMFLGFDQLKKLTNHFNQHEVSCTKTRYTINHSRYLLLKYFPSFEFWQQQTLIMSDWPRTVSLPHRASLLAFLAVSLSRRHFGNLFSPRCFYLS